MRLLYDHPGVAWVRSKILAHAWGQSYLLNSRTLDQHISQLRKRVEPDPKQPRLIVTFLGMGHRYDP